MGRSEKAKRFADRWLKRIKDPKFSREMGQTQKFWDELLVDVFNVDLKKSEHPDFDYIEYEYKVNYRDHSDRRKKLRGSIDAYIIDRNIIIEQKKPGTLLNSPSIQKDNSVKTPLQQAMRYDEGLPFNQHAEYIITSNFEEFYIYNMVEGSDLSDGTIEPTIIRLEDLEKDYEKLEILIKDVEAEKRLIKEEKISVETGEIISKIYQNLLKKCVNPNRNEKLHDLNLFCVRLVFIFFAESSGLFPEDKMFKKYMEKVRDDSYDFEQRLKRLFNTLNKDKDQREAEHVRGEIAKFPYTNGGLFEQPIDFFPELDKKSIDLILKASELDWQDISPTIFGAIFESTLNPETRDTGGMHYTSISNIHKVIDPLFLDELKNEFLEIRLKYQYAKTDKELENKKQEYQKFIDKISKLKFFDPACGSGNFLTETYLSLRDLENQALKQISSRVRTNRFQVKVSLDQFFGIELNDFAVNVAKTALFIAEYKAQKETEEILKIKLGYLPLRSYNQIHRGNALRMDWGEVIPKKDCNYIIGNPPFAGRRYRNKEQIEEVGLFFDYKDVDYVACWFAKAGEYIEKTPIKVGFVSTQAITLGEQVPPIWNLLNHKYGDNIIFAWESFVWESEVKNQAIVYCVIIGFEYGNQTKDKYIYSEKGKRKANNINGYLFDGPNIYVKGQTTPIFRAPIMENGNVPLDGNALKVEPEDLPQFKESRKYLKRLVGGRELLYNKDRYVLWLVGVPKEEFNQYPEIVNRVELCREKRLAMKDGIKLIDRSSEFRDTKNPETFLALPMVSGGNRIYIPWAYFTGDWIPTNQVQIIQNADLFHFGVLSSRVHMAWIRLISGKYGPSFRYSKEIVYNNFPWIRPRKEIKEKIIDSAKGIISAREKLKDKTLAQLYDNENIEPSLLEAHQKNDRAVLEAYGFKNYDVSDEAIVNKLLKMYLRKVNKR